MLDEKVTLQNLDAMGLITKRSCKVCEHEYNAFHINAATRTYTETAIGAYYCDKCKQYSAKFHDGLIESESVSSGNYMLVFFPEYKEATIVERDLSEDAIKEWRKVKTIPLDNLTHEVALQWVKKLQTYVIFQ